MKAIGLILAGGKNRRLENLTKTRVSSAIPIASSYRSIDFSLSNMTNSGIGKVAVITQYNSRSLNDHLASSKWWNFGRKQGGLFVFTPYLTDDDSLWFRGTLDSIYQNLSFLKRSNEEYVVITNGDCVYKMDYNKIIDYHVEKAADITIACRDIEGEDLSMYGVMNVGEDGQVLAFDEKPLDPQSNTISIAIYVIKRELLIELLEKVHSENRHDFVTDLIIRYRNRLKIYGYKYNDSYWYAINNIPNYYKANMDFLNKNVRDYFTKNTKSILTKAKDEPPVKYNFNADVKNCTIGNGSIISGSVHNSVVFRDVRVGENSNILNCIIMEGCRIGDDCFLEYAILDKNVTVNDGARICGTLEKPTIIDKGSYIEKYS